MRHAGNAAAGIDGDRRFRIDIEKFGCAGKAQHQIVAAVGHEVGKLDPPDGGRHEVARHVLAGFQDGRAQERNIEHRRQFAFRVVDRRGGAGKRRVGDVEMVGLVDGQRLAGSDAGADCAGACPRLGPFGPEIEPGLAKVVVEGGVAEKFDRNTLSIRQQEHVILLGNLPVELLEPRAGDMDQIFRLLAMFAQLPLRNDDRFLRPGRVKLIGIQAAPPGFHDNRVAARIAALPDTLDFLDVIRISHKDTGLRAASRDPQDMSITVMSPGT